MVATLVATAVVLGTFVVLFVVWVYRADKALQKLVHDHQSKHYSQTLRSTKEK